MALKFLSVLAFMLLASVASAQTSRDITRFPPELAKPPRIDLCPKVPLGSDAPMNSISGRVEADFLIITIRAVCIRTMPRNLAFSILPAGPVGFGTIGLAGSLQLDSWSPGSASYRMKVQDTQAYQPPIPNPVFILTMSAGNRNFGAVLTEAQFIALQSGGTINRPPTK